MDTDALDSYLTDRTGRDLFSGVVRITRAGETVFEKAYGPADRVWDVPNSVDTRFDIASVTKLFTVVVALRAVEEGALSLDSKVVPLIGLQDAAIHPDVELHHLLTHTSGIGDDADEEAGEGLAELFQKHTSYLIRDVVEMLPLFVDRPAFFPPGEGCRYNNVGFDLAGLMAEHTMGSPYRDLVQTEVFDKAGMNESGFFSMDVVEPRVAEGADLIDGEWVRNIYSYPPIGFPQGGAHSTVADLERFLVAAQDGRLLGPEFTEMFFTPQTLHHVDEYGPRWFGYGWEFDFDPADTDRMLLYEKEGYSPGASAVLRHYPSSATTVVMLSNMAEGIWEPRQHIDAMA